MSYQPPVMVTGMPRSRSAGRKSVGVQYGSPGRSCCKHPEAEALSLLAMAAGLGKSVLSGQSSVERAQSVISSPPTTRPTAGPN
jgi:hypothetical protein